MLVYVLLCVLLPLAGAQIGPYDEPDYNRQKPEVLDVDGTTYRTLTPDERVYHCCTKGANGVQVSSKCASKICSYKRFTKKHFANAYFRKECSKDEFMDALLCLARFQDHRECCDAESARFPHLQPITDLCGHLCDPAHQTIEWNIRYKPCLDHMWPGRKCFFNYELDNPAYVRVNRNRNNQS